MHLVLAAPEPEGGAVGLERGDHLVGTRRYRSSPQRAQGPFRSLDTRLAVANHGVAMRATAFLLAEADPPSKREILRCALSLFVRDGLSETSIRAIARATHYTNPALYKFFPSKEALALHLFERCYAHLFEVRRRGPAGRSDRSGHGCTARGRSARRDHGAGRTNGLLRRDRTPSGVARGRIACAVRQRVDRRASR